MNKNKNNIPQHEPEEQEEKEDKEKEEEEEDEDEEGLNVINVSEFMKKDLKKKIKSLVLEADKEYPGNQFAARAGYIKDKLNADEEKEKHWNVIILGKGGYSLSYAVRGTSISVELNGSKYHIYKTLE